MSDAAGTPPPEEMRLPSAPELVLSTVQLAVTLAATAISQRAELEQAQLAIDTADALLPLVARLVPAEQLPAYKRAVAELQLAYAEAVGDRPGAGPPPAPQPQQEHPQPRPSPSVETPPRPRIWTPGGDV